MAADPASFVRTHTDPLTTTDRVISITMTIDYSPTLDPPRFSDRIDRDRSPPPDRPPTSTTSTSSAPTTRSRPALTTRTPLTPDLSSGLGPAGRRRPSFPRVPRAPSLTRGVRTAVWQVLWRLRSLNASCVLPLNARHGPCQAPSRH